MTILAREELEGGCKRSSRRAALLVCGALLTVSGCFGLVVAFRQPGVEYAHHQRADPRPLQIHVLKIDLLDRSLEPAIDVAPDPDGDGPAETVLVDPLEHVERGRFVAAVNANAWAMVPPPPAGEHPHYVAGGACDIAGWVLADGVPRSPAQFGYWSFWLDRGGTPHIGNISAGAKDARWAVAGFGGLLEAGKVLPGPSDVRHPRTALGLDREARKLILAVVDGRQPGYSEGMSERELAELMLELGCHNALNLDGGGSASMIVREPGGKPRIVNRPSDKVGPRPVPVLFGVRPRRYESSSRTRTMRIPEIAVAFQCSW